MVGKCTNSMFCNHANEVPAQCPCKDDCYCRVEGTCRDKTVDNRGHQNVKVDKTVMANNTNTIIQYAREVTAERLYGDLDYYIGKTTQRNKVIDMLCAAIEVQEKELQELRNQQSRLVEKVLGLADKPSV